MSQVLDARVEKTHTHVGGNHSLRLARAPSRADCSWAGNTAKRVSGICRPLHSKAGARRENRQTGDAEDLAATGTLGQRKGNNSSDRSTVVHSYPFLKAYMN